MKKKVKAAGNDEKLPHLSSNAWLLPFHGLTFIVSSISHLAKCPWQSTVYFPLWRQLIFSIVVFVLFRSFLVKTFSKQRGFYDEAYVIFLENELIFSLLSSLAQVLQRYLVCFFIFEIECACKVYEMLK